MSIEDWRRKEGAPLPTNGKETLQHDPQYRGSRCPSQEKCDTDKVCVYQCNKGAERAKQQYQKEIVLAQFRHDTSIQEVLTKLEVEAQKQIVQAWFWGLGIGISCTILFFWLFVVK